MKTLIVMAAALALSGCVSHNFSEGARQNWRCAGDKEFSLRRVADRIEVFAAGQTHALQPSGEDAYSNGIVTLTRDGGRATLTGVHDGPYENCRRRGSLRFW
jgi:hypothetical protein